MSKHLFKKITFSILFVLGSLQSFSQMIFVKERPSFYLGKRATLDINIVYQPGLEPGIKPKHDILTMDKQDRNNSKIFPLYTHVNQEVAYSLGLTNSLGAYAKFGYYSRSKNDSYYSVSSSSSSLLPHLSGFSEFGYAQLRGLSYGLGVKWFQNSKAALGPIGSYLSFGSTKHNYSVTHKDMYLSEGELARDWVSVDDAIPLDDYRVDFSYFTIDFEMGNTHLITKNIYLKLALSSSLNLGLETFGDQISPVHQSVEEYLTYTAKQSMAYSNLITMKGGLGFVLH